MKSIILPIILLVAALSVAVGQSTNKTTSKSNGDEQELLRLQRLASEASQRADAATLNRIIADDFLMTYSRGKPDSYGKFLTKAQVLKKWGTPNPDISSSFAISDQRVHISGNTAVIFALITDKWRDKEGVEHTMDSWVSDVWVKRKGKWLLFSSHETLMAEQ